jgi:hypothetical protein
MMPTVDHTREPDRWGADCETRTATSGCSANTPKTSPTTNSAHAAAFFAGSG